MIKDMTAGSPIKLIMTFAVPVLIGNIFQQLYNISDILIVGRLLGVEALAAVGVSADFYGAADDSFRFYRRFDGDYGATFRSQRRVGRACFGGAQPDCQYNIESGDDRADVVLFAANPAFDECA